MCFRTRPLAVWTISDAAAGFAPANFKPKRNTSNISSKVKRYQTTWVPRNNGFVVGELYESIVLFIYYSTLRHTLMPTGLGIPAMMALGCSMTHNRDC